MAPQSRLAQYLLYDWLFQDVNQPEVFRRHAAIAHNKAHRRHLLTYMRRWTLLTTGLFLLGMGIETTGSNWCVVFYVLSVMAVSPTIRVFTAWWMMGRPGYW
ncbi:MAG TPA: hypothetical protein VGE55_09265 [Limnobacter sp.]|uniref:hypothetical protein n=1 Tax=Limnobacter sp. TaxID=2003368 RepID=UPI002EDB7BE3